MKYCPSCKEEFEEDEFGYCTFDGEALCIQEATASEIAALDAREDDVITPRYPSPKKRFLVIAVAAILVGSSSFAAYMLFKRAPKPGLTKPAYAGSPVTPVKAGDDIQSDEAQPKVEITQLSDAELLRIVPKHLLRRFRPGENGEPRPDELRVFQGGKANYVVMVGTGRTGAARTALDQVLVLKHEDGEFQDITRGAVPGLAGSGSLALNTHVRFDSNGTDLVLRRPASTRTIIDECPICEHAYQQVTLEWKGSHFAEKQRQWDNDRYTAFYVAAEALERRRVDRLARPLIDHPLDATIAEGFERQGRRGWVVENLTDDVDAPLAEYELKNGPDRLVIRVAKVDGQWKATRIMAQ